MVINWRKRRGAQVVIKSENILAILIVPSRGKHNSKNARKKYEIETTYKSPKGGRRF